MRARSSKKDTGSMVVYSAAETQVKRLADEMGMNFENVVPSDEETPYTFVVDVPTSMSSEGVLAFCNLCKDVLKKEIPVNSNRWSWALLCVQSNRPIGTFVGGWTGHRERWIEAHGIEEVSSPEWEQLYGRLLNCLLPHGRNDAVGNGEFWLLDDDYGSCEQRVYIFRIEVLTTELIGKLQRILKTGFSNWSIQVVLELLPPDEDVPKSGIGVFSDTIEEYWDRRMLQARFGNRFKA